MLQNAQNTFFRNLDGLQAGTLTVTTPDGKTRIFEGRERGEEAHLQLHDWRVVANMAAKGDIGFAEDYRAGRWETNDLTALTTLGLMNRSALDRFVTGGKTNRIMAMLSYLMKMNSIKGSKKNIHAHYDLGNDFYALWLDPSMTYSSALYRAANETLEDAQHNKYDRILDCLDQKSGSILEIGCGWGGFAERAMHKGDYALKGLTLSTEQQAYAQKRLGDDANIALEDYRHQDQKFDNIVSIEMFEAVGEQYWPTYFAKVKELLSQKGKAVIQTITINDADFPRYRKGGDFIRSFIFPGGMLPSPSRFTEEANKAGLRVNNEFAFGQHYARTLIEWLKVFDDKKDKVKALGFDDGFIRLWRFLFGRLRCRL